MKNVQYALIYWMCVAVITVCAHDGSNSMLWECHCWDYVKNELLKKNTVHARKQRTMAPTVKPTYSPVPANWPEFLKPGFWKGRNPWKGETP